MPTVSRRAAALFALLLTAPCLLAAEAPAGPAAVLEDIERLPYAELVEERRGEPVRAHLVALGAMQKARGAWRPSDSERADGTLDRFTWRAVDLYPAEELLADVLKELEAVGDLQLRFSCAARACGSSAQWANRIFGQRVLYGREASQRYQVYTLSAQGRSFFVMLYASARTSDRQYLHAEVLERAADQ